MHLIIAAAGKLKDGPDRELYARYAERLGPVGRVAALGPLKLVEIPESRAGTPALRKADEAERLMKAAAGAEQIVALDETGKSMSSALFAGWLSRTRDFGCKGLAFVIGGADGLSPDVSAKAVLKLSLGAMTLPHGLARIVLAEQLYRAATILSGHPYHRA
jgi:23S rRNA (pseudouridine1915-N3)-methyltransferase